MGTDDLQPSQVRWAAVLLVLVQSAALALLVRGNVFAVVMSLLAVGSLQTRWRIAADRAPHWLWFAFLALVIAAKHRLAPEALNEQITFFHTVVAYEAARYLVFVQVALLWIDRSGQRLPSWFVFLSVLGMVFACNVRLNGTTRPAAITLSLMFVISVALFAASHRRRATATGSRLGRAVMCGVLVLIALASLGVSRLLQQYEGHIERWLAGQRISESRSEVTTGFSGRGHLGEISAWKEFGGEQIALRIHAEQPPGYLRGMVFEELRGNLWGETSPVRPLVPAEVSGMQRLRSLDSIYPVPSLIEQGAAVDAVLDCWPTEVTGERLFLPQDTAGIAMPPMYAAINKNDLVGRTGTGKPLPYTAFRSSLSRVMELDELERSRYLQIDDEIVSELRDFVTPIVADAGTPSEKMRAVTRFFHDNFQYQLTSHPGHHRNIVMHFLRERPPAHCEYFATAGAMLLRAAGVPTRYVTGYVVSEHNPAGNFWIARGRDAHAWIEAYDDPTGQWRRVECTPSVGVPDQSAVADGWSNWWDAKWQWLHEMAYRAGQGGVVGFLLFAFGLLISPMGLLLLGLTAFVVGVAWRMRQRPDERSQSAQVSCPALRKPLRRADQLARRHGYRRRASETLSQFARRLRGDSGTGKQGLSALADWYDGYVRVRYGREEEVQDAGLLTGQLQVVTDQMRRTS